MNGREIAMRLDSIGVVVSRSELVMLLLLIGPWKFTAAEAAGFNLWSHSPPISWMYVALSARTFFNVIVIELTTAMLMASRRF